MTWVECKNCSWFYENKYPQERGRVLNSGRVHGILKPGHVVVEVKTENDTEGWYPV